jgi:hypothetical protein
VVAHVVDVLEATPTSEEVGQVPVSALTLNRSPVPPAFTPLVVAPVIHQPLPSKQPPPLGGSGTGSVSALPLACRPYRPPSQLRAQWGL